MGGVAQEIISVCGEPRNYGLTAEDKAKKAKDKLEAEKRKAKLEAEEMKKQEIAEMDESALLKAAMPLRKYLESNVMAVARRGVIECAEVRPNDPIDYLAEYLLNNTV